MVEGPGRVGPGAGRRQVPARVARGHHLHARLRRRRRAQRPPVARRAVVPVRLGRGGPARRDRVGRGRHARPAQDRRRPAAVARAHLPLEPDRAVLARGARLDASRSWSRRWPTRPSTRWARCRWRACTRAAIAKGSCGRSTTCWRRRASRPGARARRSTSPACCGATTGKPRLSIVYTAHLDDDAAAVRDGAAARQDQDVDAPPAAAPASCARSSTWTRSSGTSRRTPHNPPTKRPLLTLLKQARAQGVGVVLATQNPVDLDYKGLANMGTWLVGKLQTDQDRERLRDGLIGVGPGPQAARSAAGRHRASACSCCTTSIARRPVLMHSRWAMSYLRGPLTREEIARLMKDRAPAAPAAARPPGERRASASCRRRSSTTSSRATAAQLAEPYVFVKYAARFKGAGEAVGPQGLAPRRRHRGRGAGVGADRASKRTLVDRRARGRALCRPARLRDREERAPRRIEKALKDRLPRQARGRASCSIP